MDSFIRQWNVERFRHLLASVTDEAKRKVLRELLAEEERKQRDAGDLLRSATSPSIVAPAAKR
jgi:hypothetical protein